MAEQLNNWMPDIPDSFGKVSKDRLSEIKRDAKTSTPGQWAERLSYGPACTCGYSEKMWTYARSTFKMLRPEFAEMTLEEKCFRHGR